MNPLIILEKPEYLFRPSQILTRLKRSFVKPSHELEEVTMPWGARLRVRPNEVIGAIIWYYGIFDLIVAEILTRLLDRGETAADVGANIGHMSSLMSRLVTDSGRVHAFEPHPELFEELKANLDLAAALPGYPRATLHNVGLSSRSGEASLAIGEAWEGNRGVAKVVSEPSGRALQIKLAVMDEVFPDQSIGVCKIDVEGHEFEVLSGARRLLEEKRIRDIVFEDFEPFPSRTSQLLLDHGYTLFSLWQKINRPGLSPAVSRAESSNAPEDSNYLATLEPDRALERLKPGGWKVLHLPR